LGNVSFTGHFAQFWLGWTLHLWSWIIWFWNLINYIFLFIFILSLFFLLYSWFFLWEVIDNNSNLIDFFLVLFIQGCIIGLSFLFLRLGWNFRFHGASGLGNSWWYFRSLWSHTLNFINWFSFNMLIESRNIVLAQSAFLIETAAHLTWILNVWSNLLDAVFATGFWSLTSCVLISLVYNLILCFVSISSEIIFLRFLCFWNNSSSTL